MRVGRPRATGRAHWHAAHAFNTAADGHICLAGHDFGRSHVTGLEAGGAEAVNLNARGRFSIISIQNGDARDVCALLAHRADAAKNNIVHLGRVEFIPVTDGLQDLGRKAERGDLVQ